MARARAMFAAAACAVAFLSALLAPGAAAAAQRPSNRQPLVVMVLAPYLNWEDLASTPALRGLASRHAVGNMNVRSRIKPEEGQTPSAEGAALTVSAGYRNAEVTEALRRADARRGSVRIIAGNASSDTGAPTSLRLR